MRATAIWMVAMMVAGSAFSTQAVAKATKGPTAAQLQAQVKKLTVERDDLKERLVATEDLQQDLAAAKKSRDLARQEAESAKKALADIKAALSENQNSGDAILLELRKAKDYLSASQGEVAALKQQLVESRTKLAGEGALVLLSREITPARAINIHRVTPRVKKVDRGVVVVNVLISENGEVLDSRLIQGLPGDDEWVRKANDECVEAAKRVVFDPARAADGKTKVRVWQGVGFYLN